VIITLPTAVPVTKPSTTVASPREVQLAVSVRFSVEPSEKFPVAVSCIVVSFGIEECGGVTVIDSRIAAVTAIVADPEIPA
jgi:hypothetical protein